MTVKVESTNSVTLLSKIKTKTKKKHHNMNFHYLVQKSSLGALRRSPRKRPSSTREMMEESDKEFETDADTPSSSWTVCSTYHKQFH